MMREVYQHIGPDKTVVKLISTRKLSKRHHATVVFGMFSASMFDQQSFSNCVRVFISASMCRCGIRPDRSGGTFKSRFAPRARQMERMPTNSMTDRGASLS